MGLFLCLLLLNFSIKIEMKYIMQNIILNFRLKCFLLSIFYLYMQKFKIMNMSNLVRLMKVRDKKVST